MKIVAVRGNCLGDGAAGEKPGSSKTGQRSPARRISNDFHRTRDSRHIPIGKFARCFIQDESFPRIPLKTTGAHGPGPQLSMSFRSAVYAMYFRRFFDEPFLFPAHRSHISVRATCVVRALRSAWTAAFGWGVGVFVSAQCKGHTVTGLRVGRLNAQRYFARSVANIELHLDHLRIVCGLPPEFWLGEGEIHDRRLCAWLEAKSHSGRSPHSPIRLAMIPSGENCFTLGPTPTVRRPGVAQDAALGRSVL